MAAGLSWFKLVMSNLATSSCSWPAQTSSNQQPRFKTYLTSISWIFQQGYHKVYFFSSVIVIVPHVFYSRLQSDDVTELKQRPLLTVSEISHITEVHTQLCICGPAQPILNPIIQSADHYGKINRVVKLKGCRVDVTCGFLLRLSFSGVFASDCCDAIRGDGSLGQECVKL